MRIGPGEMKKIIDEAIAKKDRHPLEEYILFLEHLAKLFPDKTYKTRESFGDKGEGPSSGTN